MTVRHVASEVVLPSKSFLAVWTLVGLEVAVAHQMSPEVEFAREASRAMGTLEGEIFGG